MLFADNKSFDPPQGWYVIDLATLGFTKFEIFRFDFLRGCYLINSATLVFTTFEISKHSTFAKSLIQKVFEGPN